MKKIYSKIKITNWPLWLQLFFLILLILGLFIGLQLFVNSSLLRTYYIDLQVENIKNEMIDYENDLEDNYFDASYSLYEKSCISSIIIEDGTPIYSSQEYGITVEGEYVIIPNAFINLNISDNVSLSFHDDELVCLSTSRETFTFSSLASNRVLSGSITEIVKPENLNFLFTGNQIVLDELHYYKSFSGDFSVLTANTKWYNHNFDGKNNIVFVHQINETQTSLAIYAAEESEQLINTINRLNAIIYLIVFLIAIAVVWYASRFIALPFENITYVANQLSNLNFKAVANEYKNKESSALTNSINKMSNSLNNTIARLNTQNKEMKELSLQQEKQFQAKKQLVSAISHEIKTPLAIIQATISGIIDGIFDESQVPNELNNILKEINNTSEMLQEVLDVYRLDNESFILDTEELNIVLFTQKIVNSFAQISDTEHNMISVIYDNEDSYILGDYRQLKRVITNLIVNALKYSPAGENIYINIKLSQNDVLFEITNFGVTIPENDLPNLFEPFYRVDKSGNRTEKTKGTGLGLYIVKQILEKHRFSYGIKNVENGVCTYFIAPLVKRKA